MSQPLPNESLQQIGPAVAVSGRSQVTQAGPASDPGRSAAGGFGVSQTDAPEDGLPAVFPDEDSLRAWGGSSSWGGGHCTELAFGPHRLIVVFRRFTSGVPSTEPLVFVARGGVWRRLLCAERHWFAEATASIEGDWLVIWLHSAAGRVEWLRLNLTGALAPTAGKWREPAPTPEGEPKQAEAVGSQGDCPNVTLTADGTSFENRPCPRKSS